MISTTNQVIRITYEAFSKFSNNLVRCRTFEEISHCFKVNLKYLFNYHIFRATYKRNDMLIQMVVSSKATTFSISGNNNLLGYEEELLQKKTPIYSDQISEMELPKEFNLPGEENGELWGWNFCNDDRQIIVSVLAGESRKFSKKDIPILKLVSETLESKLLELCLFKELDHKTETINRIIEDQKAIIELRTSEIEQKNKTLLGISVLNAHNIREPLSRIMGLTSLFEIETSQGIIEEIVPKMKISAADLDNALRSVIEKATADLIDLKA